MAGLLICTAMPLCLSHPLHLLHPWLILFSSLPVARLSKAGLFMGKAKPSASSLPSSSSSLSVAFTLLSQQYQNYPRPRFRNTCHRQAGVQNDDLFSYLGVVGLSKARLLMDKAKPSAASLHPLHPLYPWLLLFFLNSIRITQDQDSEIPAIGRHEFRMTICFLIWALWDYLRRDFFWAKLSRPPRLFHPPNLLHPWPLLFSFLLVAELFKGIG